MSMVHASIGSNAPASRRLLSEPAIVAGLAQAALPKSKVPWSDLVSDYDRIRDRIARVIPGFQDFNQRIQKPGGFYLGNSAARREWKNAVGKARFMSYRLEPIRLEPGELRLMTVRSHDQYNTTIYGLNDRYRGVYGERRVVFLNSEDMSARGIAEGEPVDLAARSDGGAVRVAKAFKATAYAIPSGCAAAYFPETNGLVALDSVAERSNTPMSKFIPITLVKAS